MEKRVVSLESVDAIRTTHACALSPPEARETIRFRILLWHASPAPVIGGGVPVVLEQKTTILWKCLYLLTSLKDSSDLGGTYETKRTSEEENSVHRQNTTVNVDKIRGFRPPYVWMKTFVFLHSLTIYQRCVVFCTLATGTPGTASGGVCVATPTYPHVMRALAADPAMPGASAQPGCWIAQVVAARSRLPWQRGAWTLGGPWKPSVHVWLDS